MQERRPERRIESGTLIVGVDVAKHRHVAAFQGATGFRSRGFTFTNDRVGFETLLARSEAVRGRQGFESIVFALEATGHYGHALRYFLCDRGYVVVGINPAHTKRAKELEDNSPEKSDPKDAAVIADLASQGKGRLITVPRGVYADLRRLGKLREQLVCERTRLRNRYIGLLDLVFPELAGQVCNVANRTMLRLVGERPTPMDIVSLGLGELQACLRSWSRGHLKADQAGRIYAAARVSIGLKEGLGAVRLELKQLLDGLASAEARLAEVERAQAEALEQVPYAPLLLSVPGLGPVTVAAILGETGDLRLFRDAAAVIKFAGYNLFTISSGQQRGKTRITKRGRPLLRRQLFLAACRLSKTGAPLGTFRQRLSGKAGPVVMVSACRKLLRLLVALVRDDRVYEPGRLGVPAESSAVA